MYICKMKITTNKILIFLLIFVVASCKQSTSDVYQQSTFDNSGHVMAVIEIPAGTNHKIEYHSETGEFVNDTLAGKDRIIDFLPYPGNYGFIPSTLMDEERGGDGDALDILVIGEHIKTGNTIAIKPIGTLLLKDKGELDTKIIAIPADSTMQVIQPKDYADFVVRYNAAHHIIQEWFLNYKGLGRMELLGWKDEQYALNEIQKWKIKTTENHK